MICNKIPLGTGVGLNLGDTVLEGYPAPPPLKGQSFPVFGQCQDQTAGWTKMPLGMEVVLGLSDIMFDGDPAPLT